ncbi:MAG: DoxX [Thermoleophilia bacterium]|nr:DoxX [Thermoleophilia bacterium]
MDIDIAILTLRIVFGLTLAAHGAQKLFGWWNGPGLAGFSGWLGSMGVRAPMFAALLAAVTEFGGGIALAAGFLTPIVALGIVVVMTTAILTVHLKAGFFNPAGWEYNFAIIAAAVVVTITGAGEYSLDSALGLTGGDWSGWEIGLGVFVGGVVIALLNEATRQKAPAVAAAAE